MGSARALAPFECQSFNRLTGITFIPLITEPATRIINPVTTLSRRNYVMAPMPSLASLEYSPERGRPSYRGIQIDELEQFKPRAGVRVFVPDEPGMGAGEISDPGISRLKARVRLLAANHALDGFTAAGTMGATQYWLWNTKTPDQLLPVTRSARLRDAYEFRNFLAHGPEFEELLIAVTESLSLPNLGLKEMILMLVSSFAPAGWDSAKVSAPSVTQSTPEEAARARSLALRDELLAQGWPTSAQVAKAMGSRAGNAAQIAAKKRAEGKLFGVWSLRDNTYVHPDFQFDESHQLRPDIPALLQVLAHVPGMSSKEDAGGWRRAFWLYGGTPQLSEQALGDGESSEPRAPAAVFGSHPDAVIALAQAEATRDADAEW